MYIKETLLNIDYSEIEPRIIGSITADSTLLEAVVKSNLDKKLKWLGENKYELTPWKDANGILVPNKYENYGPWVIERPTNDLIGRTAYLRDVFNLKKTDFQETLELKLDYPNYPEDSND